MMTLIENLPAQVLGIEASGTVTHADYRDVLIPAAQSRLGNGPLAMLYVIGPDFHRFEMGAMWDDARFGISHWRDFSRIAVVTDVGWIHDAVQLFAPLLPCPVRLFDLAGRAAARAWVQDPAAS